MVESPQKRCSCTSCQGKRQEPAGPSPRQHGRAPQSWGLQPMSLEGAVGAGSFTCRQSDCCPGSARGWRWRTQGLCTAALDAGVCPAHTCVHGKGGIHSCPPVGIVGVSGSLGTPKPRQCLAGTGCRGRVSSAARGEARPDETPRGAGGHLGPLVCCHQLPGRAEPTHLPRRDPRQGLGSLGT